MEYEIEFYSPDDPLNRSILSVTEGMTSLELETIARLQRDSGRTGVKIRAGYPVYCPKCRVRTGLSVTANTQALCRDCACKEIEKGGDKSEKT